MAADAKYPAAILEEELKNKVAADWFGAFDCSRILGKVDFCDLYKRVIRILESETLEFDFAKDEAELRRFIRTNLHVGRTGCQPVQNRGMNALAARSTGEGIFTSAVADVYGRKGESLGSKTLFSYDGSKVINDWIVQFASNDFSSGAMGTILAVANDFQHRNTINLCEPNKPWNHQFQWQVLPDNLIPSAIYFAVRLCIEADWLNDRDQFLFQDDGWRDDAEFQSDCLVYTLFSNANYIRSCDGVNHWIPFTEEEVGVKTGQTCFDNFINNLKAYQKGRQL